MPMVKCTSISVILVATLLSAAYVTPAHAQSALHSGGGPDLRTERRQVRPGCAAIVVPGTVTSDRSFIGGQCPGGLLDGMVITRIGSRGYVDTYQNGKSVGDGLWTGRNAAGNYFFHVAFRNESGKHYGGQTCVGTNAGERAASSAACRAATGIFGPEIFDESSSVMAQVVGNPGVAPVFKSAAGDEAKVPGGSFRP